MSKGDTTVHVDFEVGGASAAKMTVMDIYRAQQANASKVNDAARALAKEQQITFSEAKKALREWVRMQTQAANEAASAQKKAEGQGSAEEAARERARLSLARQKSQALEAQFMETERKRKRAADEAIRDAKRVAREEMREAKMVAREKARHLSSEMSQRNAMNKLMGRGAWGAVMGMAGYAGAGGLQSILSNITQSMREFGDKRAQMEKDISPVTALGDNVNRMGAVRAEVIGLGATMGRSNKEIADFMEGIQSITSGIDPKVVEDLKKESIELADLTGGDLLGSANLLTKTMLSYGEAFENANQVQAKMYYIQDKGGATFDQLAMRMPQLVTSGKAAGATFDEIGAAIISASAAAGNQEEAFTGTRNTFLIMLEAYKKGIELTGSFENKLRQLSAEAKKSDTVLLELFGRDTLDDAALLIDKMGEVSENRMALSQIGPEEDPVKDRLAAKYQDPRFKTARLHDLDAALIENGPNIAADLGINTNLTRLREDFSAGKHAANARGLNFLGMQNLGGVLSSAKDMPFSSIMPGLGAINGPLLSWLGNKAMEEGNDVRLGYIPEDSPLRPGILENSQYGSGGKPAEQAPTLEKTIAIASGIDETNKLLRDTNRLLGNMQPISADSKQVAKPGGGRTNAEETL